MQLVERESHSGVCDGRHMANIGCDQKAPAVQEHDGAVSYRNIAPWATSSRRTA